MVIYQLINLPIRMREVSLVLPKQLQQSKQEAQEAVNHEPASRNQEVVPQVILIILYFLGLHG